ncbi:hypothetical protein ACFLZ3_00490 [Candidatus Omnitrophota bacterium]
MKKTNVTLVVICIIIAVSIINVRAIKSRFQPEDRGSSVKFDKINYPINGDAMIELKRFGEELSVFTGEMKGLDTSSFTSKEATDFNVVFPQAKILESCVTSVFVILVLEFSHGQENQFSPETVKMIPGYIKTLQKQIDVVELILTDYPARFATNKMMPYFPKARLYATRLQRLLNKINQELSKY